MMNVLIKNAEVFVDGKLTKRDVLIQNGIITKIQTNLVNVNSQTIEAKGKVILPGLVDVHVHFRDPGLTDEESVKTGSEEAGARGGYTEVCAMPNVNPIPDTPEKLQKMIAHNEADEVIKVQQYSPVTYGEKGDRLVDFEAMKLAGAIAFSNDGIGIQTAKTMYDAMKAIAKTGLPLAAHVEDHTLMNGGVMNEGTRSRDLGLPGSPEVAETSQLARDLELARTTHVHYHVCHVSTARSVELIRRAKTDGTNVTAEVSPHHLLLDDSMIRNDNPMYKMNPPLRTKQDRMALLKGLFDGTIDMIATDHASHTAKEKGNSFLESTFGITGLETAFPLLYTKLVENGKVTLAQLMDWMAFNPANEFNIRAENEVKVGNHANFAVWDLNVKGVIKKEQMKSKGTNSPFIGTKINAQNLITFSKGKIVFKAK